jgi:hypothetical protein
MLALEIPAAMQVTRFEATNHANLVFRGRSADELWLWRLGSQETLSHGGKSLFRIKVNVEGFAVYCPKGDWQQLNRQVAKSAKITRDNEAFNRPFYSINLGVLAVHLVLTFPSRSTSR